MTTFRIGHPFVADAEQQRNNEDLLSGLNQIAQFIFFNAGAPTFTPAGRAMYFRTDGGAGTSFYVYNGAAWTAVA